MDSREYLKDIVLHGRQNWHKNIVMDDAWTTNWEQERRDGTTKFEERRDGTTKFEERRDGTTKFVRA